MEHPCSSLTTKTDGMVGNEGVKGKRKPQLERYLRLKGVEGSGMEEARRGQMEKEGARDGKGWSAEDMLRLRIQHRYMMECRKADRKGREGREGWEFTAGRAARLTKQPSQARAWGIWGKRRKSCSVEAFPRRGDTVGDPSKAQSQKSQKSQNLEV